MSPEKRPLLICLVGINGAGKSTYFRHKLQHLKFPFLNADNLAREVWPDAPDEHAYDAGRQTARQREQLIAQGKSFITETVFSHPSKRGPVDVPLSSAGLVHFSPQEAKFSSNRSTTHQRIPHPEKKNALRPARKAERQQALELLEKARASRYRTWLIYIHLEGPELAKLRVEERVSRGGHPVPEEKIAPRFHRLFEQMRRAIPVVDKALLLDNSWHDRPFEHVATLSQGILIKQKSPLPEWARQLLS